MPDWKIYRTRYLVKAQRLTQVTVIRDQFGKFQSGDPGDYLVQCSDGTQRISPRHVFEDVYVEMSEGDHKRPPARRLQIPAQPGNPAG